MPKQGFVTVTEFAKLVGVTENAIRYAVSKGKITTKLIGKRKMIDPDKGQVEWESSVDKTAQAKGKKKKTNKKQTSKVEDFKPETFQGQTLHQAEHRDKVYKARLSELKYLEQAGELCKVVDIKKEAFEIARKTRDDLMTIPARIAHEVAVETDPRQVEIMLNKEIANALNRLAKEVFKNGS